MQFSVLGSLRVVGGDGELIVVSAPRLRVLLAVLLWRANQPVPADELAEMIWDGAPPAGTAAAVRALVKRLRRVLGEHAGARIVTRAPGYMIELYEDELDASWFETLGREAGAAARAGRWAEAGHTAAVALGLWHGTPLADVSSQLLRDQWVPHLEQVRVQVLEWRIEADLHEGRHEELIGELRDVIVRHPLREHFHAQLMLALARAGRQAEALAVYQQARVALVSELGIEPGPELRQVHERILAGDAALVPPTSAHDKPVVPRELPGAVRHFTGRETELAALTALIEQTSEKLPGTVVISAIGGTAGVGKTALAVQWAHQVAEQFPHGQLYMNLRGYDPAEPVSAATALAGLLRTLGVPTPDIPDGVEDRSRLYRSILAGHRMLVVLDNARDGDQVRPMLPGDPGCVAVVTSRDTLAGLVAADGARRLDLDLLPLADAVALLRSLIGGRVDDDPEAAAALAELCARLPLALRIAAELAAARSSAPLRELVAELAASRLNSLDAGEDRADVRAVFSWSFRHLPDGVTRALALIGLHPGADLDVHAVAALTDTTTGQVRRALGRLHRASLIQAVGPGRYGMHDLLRAYAREQAAARDADGSCHRALTQLFDYYLAAAAAAMDVLFPAEAYRRPRITPGAAVMPAMPDEGVARAWLDSERANLVAVVAHCADHGWPRHATVLASMLFRYLITGSHLPEADTIYSHALQAARRPGDLAAEASALNGLGGIGVWRGRFRDAVGHYQAALERYRRCGDRVGQGRVLYNLGLTEQYLNNRRSAAG